MIDSTHGMALVRRVLAEHRRIVIPLSVALVVNLLAYSLIVYPLSQRVANVTQRDLAAEQSLSQAKAEHGEAAGTLTGKARASTELTTFYNDILPRDLSGARRLTYLRLAQLARESNLRFESGSYKPVKERDSTLTRLGIELVLAGSYADVRTFIHELESSPEFVVIDNVELSEGADGGNLVVTLELSTYYRNTAS
jgi:Tfp pilus assembly protein PilO